MKKEKNIQQKQILITGDFVRFYDCDQANRDRDYSGTKSKYYPIGKIINVYNYTTHYGFTDKVCDIQIGERISKAHFISGVEIIN